MRYGPDAAPVRKFRMHKHGADIRQIDDGARYERYQSWCDEWLADELGRGGQQSVVAKAIAPQGLEYAMQNELDMYRTREELSGARAVVQAITWAWLGVGNNSKDAAFLENMTSKRRNNPDTEFSSEELAKQKKIRSQIWFHRDPHRAFTEGWESSEYVSMDRENLREAATKLLTHPWFRCQFLEWAIVDALVYDEIVQFGDAIKERAPGPKNFLGTNQAYQSSQGQLGAISKAMWLNRVRRGAFWLIVPPAIAYAFLRFGLERTAAVIAALWVLGVAITLSGAALRLLLSVIGHKIGIGTALAKIVPDKSASDWQTAIGLFKEMADFYAQLDGPLLSPSFIRE